MSARYPAEAGSPERFAVSLAAARRHDGPQGSPQPQAPQPQAPQPKGSAMSTATWSPALAAGDRVRMKDAPEETGWITSHPNGRENPGGLVEIDWESGGWTREQPGDLEVRISWSEGWQKVRAKA